MAIENVIKEAAPSFDLGVEESAAFGNMQAASDFLSGTDEVTGDAGEIEKIEEKKEEKKQTPKPPVKAAEKEEEEEEKPSVEEEGKKSLESLLGEDENEEEEEKKVEKKETKEEEEEETPSNTYGAFSKELYDLGVLTTEDDEEPVLAEKPEDLLALFQEEKKKGATKWLEGYLARFGDDRRELFDAIFVNGVNPETYLPVYNQVQSLAEIDLEVEENQETVVRSYYSRLNWAKEKIDAKVEKLKTYSDLEDEAKTVHPQMLEQDKQTLADIEEAEVEKQQKVLAADQDYKNRLQAALAEKVKTKDFDGIPLDDKTAARAFDFMYTKKWKLPSGELLTDFDKFVLESKNGDNINARIKVSLLALNNFDLSKVEKKALTTKSTALFGSLATKEKTKNNTIKKQTAGTPAPW